MEMNNVSPLFAPDEFQIKAHLDKLFSRCADEYPGGKIELRIIHPTKKTDKGRKKVQAFIYDTTPEGIQLAVEAASSWNMPDRGYNIYVGVNPRKPDVFPGDFGKAEDVEISFFHFADSDTREAMDKLAKAPLNFTFAVKTGTEPFTRPHVYWELEEPTRNMVAWSEQQGAIADHFGTDRVIDPPRIMRLAGTVNYPDPKKVERGYKIEVTTIRTDFDDDRDPVTSEAMAATYRSQQRQTAPVVGEGFQFDDGSLQNNIAPLVCLEAIRRGENLHINTRDLIAHLVGAGYPDWLIANLAGEALQGHSDGGTLAQVPDLIASARQKYGKPNPEYEAAPLQEMERQAGLEAGEFDPAAFDDIQPRQWVYGYHLIAKYASFTLSPGGVGKSTLTMIEAIAIATGRPLLGVHVHKPGPVWIFNLEDPLDEIYRRLKAICLAFEIDPTELKGKVFVNSGRDTPLCVAVKSPKGNAVATPHVDVLIRQIKDKGIVAMFVDPFVRTHQVEENDNGQIDVVATSWAKVCHETGACVDLVHHTRKTNGTSHAGDVETSRGAGSAIAAARQARTLAVMSEDEAATIGVPSDKRKWYVRVDDGKDNMSAPAERANWLQRESIDLGNGSLEYPLGDSVGVLKPWKMPSPYDDFSHADLNAIISVIDKGPTGDGRETYSAHPNAKKRHVRIAFDNWASEQLHPPEITEAKVKTIVADWLKSGLLQEKDDLYSPARRTEVTGLIVDHWLDSEVR